MPENGKRMIFFSLEFFSNLKFFHCLLNVEHTLVVVVIEVVFDLFKLASRLISVSRTFATTS